MRSTMLFWNVDNRVCLALFVSSLFLAKPFPIHGLTPQSSPKGTATTTAGLSPRPQQLPKGNNNNVLILDHLNINYEKGRCLDWLQSFYFDFLQCQVDPRKEENYRAGKKTVWANLGAHQFHLPEGKPHAQVLDGIITLVYPDLSKIQERIQMAQERLKGSLFRVDKADPSDADGPLLVTDPWGSVFRLVQGNQEHERDIRGQQPRGEAAEGLAIRDLTFFVQEGSNIDGIGRFYEQVLGALVLEELCQPNERCVVSVGPYQTLSFVAHSAIKSANSHVDLRDDQVEPPEGFSTFLSNYGPHISLYVADLPSTYKKADALGVVYVNPRFKRRAYTLDQAVDDCMFRCLNIVDPENPEHGVIVQLEHEIRSVITRDGTKYKSCPFEEIPDDCKTL